MWDELRYRWELRKYLKAYTLTKKVHSATKNYERVEGEADVKRGQQKEQVIQEQEIGIFRSNYLIEQAYLYHVPIPEDEASWLYARYLGKKFLAPQAAMKLRADINAEKKANWEFWQARVTLALAIIGSVFGVLAFFRK
jgi:hypothetical protein